MINIKRFILVGLLLGVVLILVGCNIRIGWVTTNLPGHSKAKYFYFSGEVTRSFKVSVGDKVNIKYNYKVKRGNLKIKCLTPDVRELILSENPGNKEIEINKTGRFKVIIQGEKTRGNFDISWDVK